MTASTTQRTASVPLSPPECTNSAEASPSAAFEVVRACLSHRPESARREAIRANLDAGLDWAAVRQEAARHRVLSLLYQRLEALLGEALPSSIRETGREHRRGVRIRNAFLAQELGRVVQSFEAAGLPVLALKGPVLAKAAFGDPASRHSVDLDVVVPGSRFSEADRLLHDMGYEYAAKRACLDGWRKKLSLYLDGQWEFVQGDSFTFDVHTRLMPPSYAFPADLTPFLERSQPVSLRGDITVPGFAPEDRILVLAHHGVKNQWRALRHVADLAGALKSVSNLDWNRLRNRARDLHAARTTQVGLLLAHDLLGVSLPVPIQDWVDAAPVHRMGALMTAYLRNRHRRDALPYTDRLRLQLTTKDTVADQLRYGVHSLLRHLWDHLLCPKASLFSFFS